MAVKKTARKSGKQGRAGKAAPPEATLPAFGLAEEILGGQKSEGEARREGKIPLNPPFPKGELNESPPLEKGGEGGFEMRETGRDFQSAIPTPQPAVDAGPEHHLVTFNLDHEEYGVNIGSVQEIIRVGQITTVPNAPEFVKGVINLRGRVIPVLNLRRRLELSEGKLTKNSRIVVVESGTKVLGLLVDGVSQVLRIPASSVDLPPAESDQTRTYIRAIGKVDSRLIMLMDLDKVLAKDGKAGEPASR